MDGAAWLEIVAAEYRAARRLAEKAAAQVGDEDFLRCPLSYHQSVGLVMKHVGGNLRSRWRDILTTDGEKPDRHRDTEFETAGETRASIEAIWAAGWEVVLDEVGRLAPDGLERTITIRGEPIGLVTAIHRSLSHTSYHVGQIVQLARHWAGDGWRPLSIPKGESEAFNAKMRERWGAW